MKHLKLFENVGNVEWFKIGEKEPEQNKLYLVTIWKRFKNDGNRLVTIGGFKYSPFEKKYIWDHEHRMIAFAELPEPYNGN